MSTHFKKRKGLNGPIEYPNGRVVYFDPSCNEYWDPLTDFYLPEDEVAFLKQLLFTALSKNYSQENV